MRKLGRNVAVSAVSSSWAELFSYGHGIGSEKYLEVAGFDAFYRLRMRYELGGVQRVLFAEVGPCSKYLFQWPECGAMVDFKPIAVMGALEHVEPETGVYSAATARDGRIRCHVLDRRPDELADQAYRIHANGDEAALALNGSSARIYPRGYARRWSWMGTDTAAGGVAAQVRGYSGGGNTEVFRSNVAETANGYAHPWFGLLLVNTGGSSLSGVLSFSEGPR